MNAENPTNPLSDAQADDGPFDVIIAGAGPVGLACGIAARRAGLSSCIIEKGCLVDAVFRFPVNMTFFTTPELLAIGGHPLICAHGKPTRFEALQYYSAVARAEELRVKRYEKVLGVEGERGAFRVSTQCSREPRRSGPCEYSCRRVILATGYYDNPNDLGIPGEDLPHVSHYYTEPHPFYGERVLIVGGKNSACEAALDLFRHGANVTLVHRDSELGDSVKYWVRPDVENRIEAGEIRALFDTRVEAIEGHSVRLVSDDTVSEEHFDQVFLLTGYHPDDALLKACGLDVDPETLRVDLDPDTREARSRPGVYLAGSVGAGYATGTVFIENGRLDAQTIVDAIGNPTA